jgi:tetratricopeptide (TPR) repeat protein
MRALNAEMRSRLEGEVAALTTAIESGHSGPDTYEIRASYLLELGSLDEAEADIQQLPEGPRRSTLLGDLAAERGDLRDAADSYEAALAAEPGRPATIRKLAWAYVCQGSFQPEAISLVRQVVDEQFQKLSGGPNWIRWITYLHERYAASAQWNDEIPLLQKVAEKNPISTNPRLGLWTVDALLASGSLDEALQVVAHMPIGSGKATVITAYRHCARACIRSGRNDRAVEILQQIAGSAQPGDAAEMATMLGRAAPGDRFVPLEKIGAGAVAEFWKAFDLYTGEYVGLKILHASLAEDAVVVSELQQEFEIMAGSLHPRLARVIAGTFNDDRFAMELLDASLMDMLSAPEARQGLAIPEAARIAGEAAEALDYLHARGLVYQDLSPQNILFRDGHVKLCDFGGARPGGEADPGFAVAKVAYASPEQCALLMGEASLPIGRQSDIYSLGVVLYHMVTGRLPYEGPDQAVIHAHLYAAPVAPMIHRSGLSTEMSRLILRCMARKPEERFATAAEFWAALDAALVEE